jgi:hypothetical protein
MQRYLVLALLGASVASAQRPDFSGTWTSTPPGAPTVATVGDASFRRGDMESGWSSTITVAQTPDSLIVSYVFFVAYDLQPPVRLAYALNGSESRNTVMIGHKSEERRSRLAFDGAKVTITTLHPAPPEVTKGAAVEVRQVLTLESPASLVIETTRAGVMGGSSSTIRTVYSKK